MQRKNTDDGHLYGLKRVLGRCGLLPRVRLVAARPYDDASLKAVAEACRANVVHALLVGEKRTISERAGRLGIEKGLFEIVHTEEQEILERTASIHRDGEADFIMKGLVSTGNFIHVLLDPKWNIRTDDILSHVGMFEIPESERIFLMSDGALNILPNFTRKMEIVKNAVQTARRLGTGKIRVAMLAALEKVRLPAMPATRDAFLMKRFSTTGYFGRCEIDGPFAFDNAIDPEKAVTKGVGGAVAGQANVLIVPNIETGNVIWKSITVLNRQTAAGVVVGGRCPIVLPSRSDDFETKLLSIRFARLVLGT
jgi:phosphate butyryltransferase